ncbi:MAG TPA: ADP-ribosylglycohydrolase family protein [Thermomicrobiales bacterium]|nr:ADP-ribosylglycohydrolase family protein [Thermomicrobiales bacterium]
MTSLEDRYLGCLIGLACGDALGGPVEFDSRETMDQRFPDGLREFIGGGWLHLLPGEITDDTQMTLDVARSLCAFPEGNMIDLADRFLAWRNSQPKDIGNTTRDALDRLARGLPWSQAGEQTHRDRGPRASAGNGAIMRCAPVAMRFRTNPDRLRDSSIDISRITHANPLCTWASVAVNRTIAALLDGESIRDAIERSTAGIALDEVTTAVVLAMTAEREAIRSGGFVLDTLSAACWSLLQTASFEEALVIAVGLGGDTDTTGAVAGALAGAHYGYEAIPTRWRDTVQHRDELASLAKCLFVSSTNAPA